MRGSENFMKWRVLHVRKRVKFVADEAIDDNKQAKCSLKIAHRLMYIKYNKAKNKYSLWND